MSEANTPWDLRIDGDVIVYAAGYAADAGAKKDGIEPKIENSLHGARMMVDGIVERFMPCDVTIYISSSNPAINFRNQIYEQYKANRKESSKPVHYAELRKYLIDKYGAKLVSFGEADDALGTATTSRTIIASVDKDLLMIPAWHWRIHKDEGIRVDDPGELKLIEKKDTKGGVRKEIFGTGLKWFIAQLLLGDKIDNIMKPKKGFGPVAVHEFLKKHKTVPSMFRSVADFYEENGKSVGDFLVNCKLLWIAREPGQIFNENMFYKLLEKGELL